MKIQQRQSPQTFTAIHIANTKNYIKNIETPIEIYELSEFDTSFLKSLRKQVNLKELMPGIDENKLNVWENIFHIAVNQVTGRRKTVLMAVHNNQPCGLMAYTQKPLKYEVNTICTWPTEQGKKVPNAGKTLFYMLFKDFIKNNANSIDLDAVTNGPFNAVSKYMKLGFKQRGGENDIIAMRATRERIIDTFQKLNEVIKSDIQINNSEVNLLEKLI